MYGRPKTLNLTESHRLLDTLLVQQGTPGQFRKGIRNYTMALLMLDAGLRVGEVVQLQWQMLYFYGEPVHTLCLTSGITKTKTERFIPLSGRLKKAMEEMHKNWWSADELAPGAYAFYQKDDGRPLTTRQVERVVRTAAMKSIGRPVHPHMLRHTFASRLMSKVNVRIVQALLGHASITSTQIYTHPSQQDLTTAIEEIGEDLTNNSKILAGGPTDSGPANGIDTSRTD